MELTNGLLNCVIEKITVDIPDKVKPGTNRAWTIAIWEALHLISGAEGLKLYPESKPYAGEYLVDFVLFDKLRGPVLACESQLWFWRRNVQEHLRDICWAFDKLRGVKSEIKLLIFEWGFSKDGSFPDAVGVPLKNDYMAESEMTETKELYVFIQFSGSESRVFTWKPIRDGAHSFDEVQISRLR